MNKLVKGIRFKAESHRHEAEINKPGIPKSRSEALNSSIASAPGGGKQVLYSRWMTNSNIPEKRSLQLARQAPEKVIKYCNRSPQESTHPARNKINCSLKEIGIETPQLSGYSTTTTS